ncbi:hypothetical protein LIER_32328 [Lithospermum erythrorhizon]|uniref:F-box domain-containing protein n=1 Tax=Lithospermum erythrorhizon TaxID=34254 RepID=A0AAV3RWN3_LITER
MDTILCDELLLEIFNHLPPPPSPSLSLVSKRWRRLFRSSTTSLSLHLPSLSSSLCNFLSSHPYLSSLSLSITTTKTTTYVDQILVCVSNSCPNLKNFTFLSAHFTVLQIQSLPTSFYGLNGLNISLSRPICFSWLSQFGCLKSLSVLCTGKNDNSVEFDSMGDEMMMMKNIDGGLKLESVCLTGVKSGDFSLNWLWRNCKKVKTLKLKSCEGIGGTSYFSDFIKCLNNLQEVELRKSRTIVDVVLLNLIENCSSLNSLLVYDGGSRESLLQFITQSRCKMQKIDLRLPLDLDNSHLFAMAENFRGLVSLRFESCCLVTGEGLKTIGRALGSSLEELALISCDVVDKEPGLLATVGQCLKRLRILDLSYNEMLLDKEINLMLVSCNDLFELKLRGCPRLTNATTLSIAKSCKKLESVDIMFCSKIGVEAVELLLLSSPRLRLVAVEQNKLSDVARSRVSNYFIKVVV